MYKALHSLAPPTQSGFTEKHANDGPPIRATRASVRGD